MALVIVEQTSEQKKNQNVATFVEDFRNRVTLQVNTELTNCRKLNLLQLPLLI